jgi:hypothetical protein
MVRTSDDPHRPRSGALRDEPRCRHSSSGCAREVSNLRSLPCQRPMGCLPPSRGVTNSRENADLALPGRSSRFAPTRSKRYSQRVLRVFEPGAYHRRARAAPLCRRNGSQSRSSGVPLATRPPPENGRRARRKAAGGHREPSKRWIGMRSHSRGSHADALIPSVSNACDWRSSAEKESRG